MCKSLCADFQNAPAHLSVGKLPTSLYAQCRLFPALISLIIDCNFERVDFGVLRLFTCLTYLSITHYKTPPGGKREFCALPKGIRHMELWNSQVSDTAFEYWDQHHLRKLECSSMSLSILQQLRNLSSLEVSASPSLPVALRTSHTASHFHYPSLHFPQTLYLSNCSVQSLMLADPMEESDTCSSSVEVERALAGSDPASRISDYSWLLISALLHLHL